MPRYDLYHNSVRNALIKDGWRITDDPFVLRYKGLVLYADLGAEKPVAAEKSGRHIVVEIKVFGGASFITELEKAVGQYGVYRTILDRTSPHRELYLAVANDIYEDFFLQPAIQEIRADHRVRIVVFIPETEEIIKWID